MEKIQEILNKGWKSYIKNHKVIGYKKKAITAIAECKTGAIGAHKYICDECGYEEIAYNSCRNRHCPNCQAGKKLQWIEARKEEVLNIKYYHVVFTIPDELNLITLQNQSKVYKILFKASAETLQELAEDKKYLGGELGFFSILHTWGQNMMYHPHVHIEVMSKVFRGKFLYYLKQEKLDFYGKNKYLENPASYNDLIQKLYNKDWIVYCKEPFNNADCVIQYLGRYTHRVAISNERILDVTDENVTFKWRDYKDNNIMKEMTVTIEEFIRRFLLHILPPHFMKIRYYGILGNRNKKKKLLKCKILTRTKIYKKEKLPTPELLKKILGKDFNLCPCCKKGHMLIPNTS